MKQTFKEAFNLSDYLLCRGSDGATLKTDPDCYQIYYMINIIFTVNGF